MNKKIEEYEELTLQNRVYMNNTNDCGIQDK